MKVLLTGATGFVGGHLLKEVPSTWTCFALTRNPDRIANWAKPILADLGRTGWENELPERMDAIIHVSQSRAYRDFPGAAMDVFDVNTASTARLLDYASRSGVRHFCLFSTGSVYEPYDHQPLVERAAVQPNSINATTKLAAEALCRTYASLFSVAILRVFFPYGPGQTDRLVPILIDRIKSGQAISLAGRDGMVFPPIYVSDLVRIAIASVEQGWQGTFNVAGRESLSVKSISKLIASHLGRTVSFDATSQQELCLRPSLQALEEVFDTSNMVSFEQGLKETLQWNQ